MMKRSFFVELTVCCLLLFLIGCGGKSSSLEGKIVDGKGQPLSNVKVAAKMSQPIKGYEQFETTSSADGTFKFGKLFPTSEYQLFFYSDLWRSEKKMKTDSGPEGQTKMLPEPVMIRFMEPKEGVSLDTKTNLMWAAKTNESDINWANAKAYCENYRGGGYTDWRMPSQDELDGLYKSGKRGEIVVWAAETRGSDAALFNFLNGERVWLHQSNGSGLRALSVRAGK